jgi:hypothetical protein
MRVASSRCSVLDGTVALRSDAPPLWWSATGDLTASRPHVLAHMGHGLRPLLLARVAKNRRCLPPAHRAPAAKTTTSKALLWPVALSDHCSVILFNYSCLELKFWLLLWICYDHYNLSSIILCICFETWHTQPQIPGSATEPAVLELNPWHPHQQSTSALFRFQNVKYNFFGNYLHDVLNVVKK